MDLLAIGPGDYNDAVEIVSRARKGDLSRETFVCIVNI